ncbi:MAG: DNA-protecting protein DprA [Oligoflexales bacterium]|nr:DNA-protecting protein DprA [Oligoflexales bacterium]
MRNFFIISHVVSQVLRRDLPLPFKNVCPQTMNGDELNLLDPYFQSDTWTQAMWLDCVKWASHFKGERNPFPWFPKYCQKSGDDGSKLVHKISQHMKSVEDNGAQYILYCDENYPGLLREINKAPHGFTCLGRPFGENKQETMISVVGSRRASLPALQESFRIGQVLANRGFCVVSGGAYGCDVSAHQGVLAADPSLRSAVVVLAGGLSKLYPEGNRAVFLRLLQEGGVLLSERLWDDPARPSDFPARNRIITGLSMLTVLMEAQEKSGALVSARLALDQGREVLVYNPTLQSQSAHGSRMLMEEGALGFANMDEFLSLF